MEREIGISGFEIILTPDGEWRAWIEISLRENGLKKSKTFFSRFSLPIENYKVSPEDIRKEIFEKFKKAYLEVGEWLQKKSGEDIGIFINK